MIRWKFPTQSVDSNGNEQNFCKSGIVCDWKSSDDEASESFEFLISFIVTGNAVRPFILQNRVIVNYLKMLGANECKKQNILLNLTIRLDQINVQCLLFTTHHSVKNINILIDKNSNFGYKCRMSQ